MNMEDEVKAMNDILDGKVPEEPKVEEPKVEESVVEATPKVEEVVEETPVVEEVPKVEEPVVDPKDEKIAALEARLAALESKPKEEPAPQPVPEPAPQPISEVDFVKDIDLDEVVRDPKEFNKLMNQVYQKGLADSEQRVVEKVLRSIPEIVQSNIKVTQELEKTKTEFFEENPDLKGFQKVLASVYQEIAEKNPGKDYKTILALTGAEARTRLGLEKKAKATIPEQKRTPPKLPSGGGKGGRGSDKPQLSGIEAEIEAMNKVVS